MGPIAEYEIARPVAEGTDTEISKIRFQISTNLTRFIQQMGSLVEINASVASSGAIVVIYLLTMGDIRRG